MPDITLCVNAICHLREKCYRHVSHWRAEYRNGWQSYSCWWAGPDGRCERFVEIKSKDDVPGGDDDND